MKRRWGGRLLALAWTAWLTSTAASAADPVRVGSKWRFVEASGHEWCVTVVVTDSGADAEPWAWFTYDGDPRRSEHVPVTVLREPCKAAAKPRERVNSSVRRLRTNAQARRVRRP